jgi:transcriptional antiterminator NusG
MEKLTHEQVMAIEPRWYVVFTSSGYENLVRSSFEKIIEKNALQERILEIAIPMEDVIEEKNGKRKVVQRKKFPCYVMLKMRYTNDMWHLVTGVRGVTSFVGPQGRPKPLSEDEVTRMKLERPKITTDFTVGEKVKVIDGALEGFIGDITAVDLTAGKCKVDVAMFGRVTPVDLDFGQIARIE